MPHNVGFAMTDTCEPGRPWRTNRFEAYLAYLNVRLRIELAPRLTVYCTVHCIVLFAFCHAIKGVKQSGVIVMCMPKNSQLARHAMQHMGKARQASASLFVRVTSSFCVWGSLVDSRQSLLRIY